MDNEEFWCNRCGLWIDEDKVWYSSYHQTSFCPECGWEVKTSMSPGDVLTTDSLIIQKHQMDGKPYYIIKNPLLFITPTTPVNRAFINLVEYLWRIKHG